jgi:uncharacterized protein (TIGR03435 family)
MDSSNKVLQMLSIRPLLLGASRTLLPIGTFIYGAAALAVAQAGNTPVVVTSADGDATVPSDLTFDVVSIRPSNAGPRQFRIQLGDDQFAAIGVPLGRMILIAYFPFKMGSRDRIVDAPRWVWDDEYDLVGKVGEANVPIWQKFRPGGFMAKNPVFQTMLRNALADRCKMAVHRGPAETDGYALVVTKHGPNHKNLVESKADDAVPDRAIRIALGATVVPVFPNENPMLHFYETSMAAFALEMSGPAPVEDKTGLSGKYRFVLPRLGTEGNQISDWDWASLGLKLVPAKIPTENIVIDHIERPSPNLRRLNAAEAGGPSTLTAVKEQLGLELETDQRTARHHRD